MSNPRDHIRAAQAAELRGDKPGAIAELREAAALYRRAGNSARALQLLRHAQTLDPSRADVAEELRRLEGAEETSSGAVVLELRPAPAEQAERQRLIDEALRRAAGPSEGEQAEEEAKRWIVEEDPAGGSRPVEIQDASRRALDWIHGREPEIVRSHPSDIGLQVKTLDTGDLKALVAEVVSPSEFHSHEEHAMPPDQEGPGSTEPRAEERALIERGPTRADPAIDAWCSFCCRPRVEVGELVAGPTGSFICAACVGESSGLLGLEGLAPGRDRPSRRRPAQAEVAALVGQQNARALLERALQAGARRVLVVGPVGTGKSVWFRELAQQERGTLMTLDALEQGAGGPVVLVEDVDRLSAEAQERLGSFLARHPERTVLLSARGFLGLPKLVLQGSEGSLPLLSTRALSEGVLHAVPVSLLEQLQIAIPLQVPTQEEFVEIAQQLLAARGAQLSLTSEVLAALAAEASSSPRSGHELSALLARVPGGSWSLLPPEQKPAAAEKKKAAQGPKAKPAGRGRRKGTK